MKKWKKGEEGFEAALQDIASRYKGLGGGPSSESSVHASKQDIREGYAWFWSDNSDVSNLIQRSRDYILEIRDHGDNISFKLEGKNLGNRPEYYYWNTSDRLSQYDEYGYTLSFGVRYSY